jgi:hypothetical protein
MLIGQKTGLPGVNEFRIGANAFKGLGVRDANGCWSGVCFACRTDVTGRGATDSLPNGHFRLLVTCSSQDWGLSVAIESFIRWWTWRFHYACANIHVIFRSFGDNESPRFPDQFHSER